MNNDRSNESDDALIRRYHEAGEMEGRAPSAAVGDAVRAHARMLDAARPPSVQSVQHGLQDRARVDRAANRARWRLSMLGSLAVIGLAGLLVLQFDRGPPQEQPRASGQRMAAPPMADAQPEKNAPPAAMAPPAATARAKAAPEPARERTVDAADDATTDADLHRLAAAGTWPALAQRLAAGAPIDERDAQGRTPLMRAAAAGQYEMVRQLLGAGADARLVDQGQRTALYWAQQSGRDDVVRLLAEPTSRAGDAGR